MAHLTAGFTFRCDDDHSVVAVNGEDARRQPSSGSNRNTHVHATATYGSVALCRNELGFRQVEHEFSRVARENLGENLFKSRHRDEVELTKELKNNKGVFVADDSNSK